MTNNKQFLKIIILKQPITGRQLMKMLLQMILIIKEKLKNVINLLMVTMKLKTVLLQMQKIVRMRIISIFLLFAGDEKFAYFIICMFKLLFIKYSKRNIHLNKINIDNKFKDFLNV